MVFIFRLDTNIDTTNLQIFIKYVLGTPDGSFPGWELSRWGLSWVRIFFGGSFPGGNCPVGINRVALFQVGVFMLPLNVFTLFPFC